MSIYESQEKLKIIRVKDWTLKAEYRIEKKKNPKEEIFIFIIMGKKSLYSLAIKILFVNNDAFQFVLFLRIFIEKIVIPTDHHL